MESGSVKIWIAPLFANTASNWMRMVVPLANATTLARVTVALKMKSVLMLKKPPVRISYVPRFQFVITPKNIVFFSF